AARNEGKTAQISGTLENDVNGSIFVKAVARDGSARAGGMGIQAQQFVGSIINKGSVTAIASGIDTVSAAAIFFLPGGTGSVDAVGHVTNDGGYLFANEIVDGSSQPGWAIDDTFEPNTVNVDLEGNDGRTGIIHGNISIGPNDTITVENGKTIFDGSIVP